MTEDEQVARAQAAQRLVNDPILQEAFAVLKKHCLGKIESSSLPQSDIREMEYKTMRAADAAWHILTSWISEGKIIEDRRHFNRKPGPRIAA